MNLEREKDIQELCRQVFEILPHEYWDDMNGHCDSTCPICGASYYGNTWVSMHKIPHEQNCGYLIAKDLATGHS